MAKLHLQSVGKVHTAFAVFMLQQQGGHVSLFVQGSYRLLDPKFKTFSRLFSKKVLLFPDSRLSNR